MENKNKKLAIILTSLAILFICGLIVVFAIVVVNYKNVKKLAYDVF